MADPGKTPNELALCCKPDVQSLKEKQEMERKQVAQLCVKLFHSVGPVGKLYKELFGPKGDKQPHAAMLLMLDDMFLQSKVVSEQQLMVR